MSGSRSRVIKDRLQQALRRERLADALVHYESLESLEPNEPRWPHRKGDLLKRLGRVEEALDAYERAVDLYGQLGFVARAAAMAKVVMAIDPDRAEVLERVTIEEARRIHRQARSVVVTADAARDEVTQTKRISADAIPLVAPDVDPSGPPRYSTPPSARHATPDLDISEAELQDRSIPADGQSIRPTPERLAQLPSMPLFAEVPQSVLARIVTESRLLDLEPGQRLIERGTTADALYALVEGSVQLVRPGDQHALLLSEGDIVGTSCLLDRVSYEGDVTACTKVRALRISKLLLDRLVHEHPPLGDILLEALGRRLVATLVRTSPVFSSLDSRARAEVAAMFEVRLAHAGTMILAAGVRADGLYIPMIGELVAIEADGREVGHLNLGRALGQHSMLTRGPSPLTVRAESDVLVLRLSARRFEELVAQQPELVARLDELAERPSSPTFSLIPEPLRKTSA